MLEEFGQLERVLADLLDGREEEGLQRQADHAAQHPAGLEEAAVAHVRVAQRLQLQQRPLLVVAVRRVDVVLAVLSAKKKKRSKKKQRHVQDRYKKISKSSSSRSTSGATLGPFDAPPTAPDWLLTDHEPISF